jgi:hypothetical protein
MMKKYCICLLLGVLSNGLWLLNAKGDPTANPQTGALGTISANGEQTLKVTNPASRMMKNVSGNIVQGPRNALPEPTDDEDRNNPHTAARATIPSDYSGDLLMWVSGIYVDNGGQAVGPAEGWTGGYNRGNPRIVLEVNNWGDSDNYIGYGSNGATMTVTVAGSNTGSYAIDLSANPSGRITFNESADATTSVTVGGGCISPPIVLNGATLGSVIVSGSCSNHSNVASGSVTATVVPAINIDIEDPKVNDVRSGLNESTLVVTLNGNTISKQRLTLTRTYETIDGEQVLVKLHVLYVPATSELRTSGNNTVTVDIDDMVENHMEQVTATFQIP